MKYWINIHHPRAINEARRDQCRVYLQERSKQRPSVGDRVFIYETGALGGTSIARITRKLVVMISPTPPFARAA